MTGSAPHEPAACSRREFCAAALALPVVLGRALRASGGEAVFPIPAQDSAMVDRDQAVMIVRDQGKVYAFVLWCPHQHTALRWQEQEHRFQCPKHKSTFEPNGSFVSGRATRDLDRYPLRREGETVVVDLATTLQQDKDAERWRQAVVQL
jgi:Rieske Fe-S protein